MSKACSLTYPGRWEDMNSEKEWNWSVTTFHTQANMESGCTKRINHNNSLQRFYLLAVTSQF